MEKSKHIHMDKLVSNRETHGKTQCIILMRHYSGAMPQMLIIQADNRTSVEMAGNSAQGVYQGLLESLDRPDPEEVNTCLVQLCTELENRFNVATEYVEFWDIIDTK